MTREEFMANARQEIEAVLSGHRNRIMNLVEKAWAEGKKNAETDQVEAILREALKRFDPPETASAEPKTCKSWHPFLETDGSVKRAQCLAVPPDMPPCTCCGDESKCDFYGG